MIDMIDFYLICKGVFGAHLHHLVFSSFLSIVMWMIFILYVQPLKWI